MVAPHCPLSHSLPVPFLQVLQIYQPACLYLPTSLPPAPLLPAVATTAGPNLGHNDPVRPTWQSLPKGAAASFFTRLLWFRSLTNIPKMGIGAKENFSTTLVLRGFFSKEVNYTKKRTVNLSHGSLCVCVRCYRTPTFNTFMTCRSCQAPDPSATIADRLLWEPTASILAGGGGRRKKTNILISSITYILISFCQDGLAEYLWGPWHSDICPKSPD